MTLYYLYKGAAKVTDQYAIQQVQIIKNYCIAVEEVSIEQKCSMRFLSPQSAKFHVAFANPLNYLHFSLTFL